ncbi:MFS transporter [Pseudomonas sp. 14P_8.1_Bac3]|uniref:spinster family MFS transporter n=1 Tax=Pseudomonas sp. 14P_8.1_Bac3 TaxID=2971621 RepID=UPI0021C8D3CE|nr:MFS transporter [Pseudomonas sp. 14P_8.1_Bac3]MCU1758619.1 MFS transporter [Pseudomonas sp. 14P_8.1_Bac3]
MTAREGTLPAARVGWRSHGLLLLLALVFADNFVGRQILAVMVEPIKAEFGVGDTAIGLISGLAFAAVYALMGLPAGRLVDRMPRLRLLAMSCLLWSLATMACGLAGGFIALAIARMLVAVSESPTTSASLSLIADLYPPQRRSFAISCFTAAPTFSSIIGLSIGAWVVEHYGWRSAFVALGVPALVFCAILALFVREPGRGRWDLTPQTHAQPALLGMGAEARKLWALPAYRCLILAGGLTTLSSYAIGMWNTSFLVRSHGLSLQHAGLLAGVICGTSAGIGGLFSGWLSDRLCRRHPHWQISIPVIGHLAALSALVPYLLWSDSLLVHFGDVPIPSAMLWCALYSFFAVWWVAPSYNLVTQLVPSGRRGTAMALQTIVSTLLGVGVGPLITGLFSDMLLPLFGHESLRYSLLLVNLPVICAVVLLVRTARHASRTSYRHVE